MSATARMMAFLGLDPKDFNKGVDGAQAKVGGFGRALDGMKGKLAAAFTITAAAVEIKKALDYSGQIADLAENLGVTTGQIQALALGAKAYGFELGDIATVLSKVSAAQAEFVGGSASKQMIDNMARLGITMQDADYMNAAQFFEAISKGAQTSAGALDAAIDTLGKRAGPKFQAMMRRVSDYGLGGLEDAFSYSGELISEASIKQADDAMDGVVARNLNRWRKFTAVVAGGIGKAIGDKMPVSEYTDQSYAVAQSRSRSRQASDDEKLRGIAADTDEIRRKTAFDLLSTTEKRAQLEREMAEIDRQRQSTLDQFEYARLDKQRAEIEGKLAGMTEEKAGGFLSAPNYTQLERIGAVGGVTTPQSPIPQKTLTTLQKMQADMATLVSYAGKQKTGVF